MINKTMKKRYILYLLIFLYLPLIAQTQPDALEMYRNGQYKESIRVCLSEIEKKSSNLDSYVVLSWALIADKQYTEAVKWCEKGRTIAKYDPRLLESLAEAHFLLGHNEIALSLFRDYIVYAPNGVKLPVVYYYMGEIYLKIEKFNHADITFSVAVNLDSRKSEWWARLGYVREQTKEYRYALEAYENALSINKNLVDAQKGKERVLRFF